MTSNPYVDIDIAYAQAVEDAIAEHERAVADANARLGNDLAAISDAIEKAEILAAFDVEIQPARDAYHNALKAAEEERAEKKRRAEVAYIKHEEQSTNQEGTLL